MQRRHHPVPSWSLHDGQATAECLATSTVWQVHINSNGIACPQVWKALFTFEAACMPFLCLTVPFVVRLAGARCCAHSMTFCQAKPAISRLKPATAFPVLQRVADLFHAAR